MDSSPQSNLRTREKPLEWTPLDGRPIRTSPATMFFPLITNSFFTIPTAHPLRSYSPFLSGCVDDTNTACGHGNGIGAHVNPACPNLTQRVCEIFHCWLCSSLQYHAFAPPLLYCGLFSITMSDSPLSPYYALSLVATLLQVVWRDLCVSSPSSGWLLITISELMFCTVQEVWSTSSLTA